jgi:hypothetical protein
MSGDEREHIRSRRRLDSKLPVTGAIRAENALDKDIPPNRLLRRQGIEGLGGVASGGRLMTDTTRRHRRKSIESRHWKPRDAPRDDRCTDIHPDRTEQH